MNASTEKNRCVGVEQKHTRNFLNSVKTVWTLIPTYAVWYPTQKAQNQKGTEII